MNLIIVISLITGILIVLMDATIANKRQQKIKQKKNKKSYFCRRKT